MNIRPDIDDKTKIILLKIVVAMGAAGTLTNLFFLQKMYKLLEKVSQERSYFARKLIFASKVIGRYTELADDEISEKIYNEFAFEWVTLEFDNELLKGKKEGG
jgi:hypothetical protein